MHQSSQLFQNRFLAVSVLTVTLSVGIVIGSLFTGGVFAGKGQQAAPDATPLAIPSPVQMNNEFARLAKQVESSVVFISTETKARETRRGEGQGGEEDPMDLFRRFFPRNGPGNPMQPGQRAPRRAGSGSGFVVDKNGYIITNNHVVDSADVIRVSIPNDEREYKARLIGRDEETDMAVIKIDAGRPLQAIRIGNSDAVQVGDWAVAIGAPFGLETTVTAGIISAKGRDIGSRQFQHFIQTDAAINPGNSGGPLLNANGEVVGINTMIATESGGSQGVGFALPVNMAVKVYNQIIQTGRVTRGSIGIRFNKKEAESTMRALKLSGGVLVSEVTKDGPAARAGLKGEDIITAINGKEVKNGDDLVSRVADTPVGTTVTLSVDRDGQKKEIPVTIADRALLFADNKDTQAEALPDLSDNKDSQVKFGLGIRALSDEDRGRPELSGMNGVQVTRVEPDSFAEEIGIRERDVILRINRETVASIEDIRRVQSGLKPGDPVAFRVGRMDGQRMQMFWLSGELPR
jgi:serine protease Do